MTPEFKPKRDFVEHDPRIRTGTLAEPAVFDSIRPSSKLTPSLIRWSIQEVRRIANKLAQRRIRLEVTPEARRAIASEGYEPAFGARPLKRFRQRHLETRLARALIAGEVGEDSTVTFKVKGEAETYTLNLNDLKNSKDGKIKVKTSSGQEIELDPKVLGAGGSPSAPAPAPPAPHCGRPLG